MNSIPAINNSQHFNKRGSLPMQRNPQLSSLNLPSTKHQRNIGSVTRRASFLNPDDQVHVEALDLLNLDTRSNQNQHFQQHNYLYNSKRNGNNNNSLPKSSFQVLPELAEKINTRTTSIQESLGSNYKQADVLYYKFLIRQRDKSPPT